MPKGWSISFAKLFREPVKQPFTRWPKRLPAQERVCRRSQLRFTPIAAGRLEPWIITSLIRAQGLLDKGENDSALELCHKELSYKTQNTFPRPGRPDFFHRAVSLFTRHRDFDGATSLCNRMVKEGYVIPMKTYMVMTRGMQHHTAKQFQEIWDAMFHGPARMDDLAFQAFLDSMVVCRYPAEDLERAVGAYAAAQPTEWVPPTSVFGTVIQAHAREGHLDRAEQWLDNFREVRAAKAEKAALAASSQTQVIPYDSSVRLRRHSGVLVSTENPRYPYAAFLSGVAQLPKANPRRVRSLFSRMRTDGIDPDIDMYNMVIPALVRWGWTQAAYSMYRSLLEGHSSLSPDAYTFRHLFVALNPLRRRHNYEQPPPMDLSTRQLCYDMIKLDRLRLRPRKPQSRQNIISAATFNCALGTYVAQGDYAAAWTIIALFARYHIPPDAKTSRIIILSLLRRMQTEMHKDLKEVMWMDRFLGERREAHLNSISKMLLADRLYLIGHVAMTEMRHLNQRTYVQVSRVLTGSARDNVDFLVALLRSALVASLGFTRGSPVAEEAVSTAMYNARNEMIPRGRFERN